MGWCVSGSDRIRRAVCEKNAQNKVQYVETGTHAVASRPRLFMVSRDKIHSYQYGYRAHSEVHHRGNTASRSSPPAPYRIFTCKNPKRSIWPERSFRTIGNPCANLNFLTQKNQPMMSTSKITALKKIILYFLFVVHMMDLLHGRDEGYTQPRTQVGRRRQERANIFQDFRLCAWRADLLLVFRR